MTKRPVNLFVTQNEPHYDVTHTHFAATLLANRIHFLKSLFSSQRKNGSYWKGYELFYDIHGIAGTSLIRFQHLPGVPYNFLFSILDHVSVMNCEVYKKRRRKLINHTYLVSISAYCQSYSNVTPSITPYAYTISLR